MAAVMEEGRRCDLMCGLQLLFHSEHLPVFWTPTQTLLGACLIVSLLSQANRRSPPTAGFCLVWPCIRRAVAEAWNLSEWWMLLVLYPFHERWINHWIRRRIDWFCGRKKYQRWSWSLRPEGQGCVCHIRKCFVRFQQWWMSQGQVEMRSGAWERYLGWIYRSGITYLGRRIEARLD